MHAKLLLIALTLTLIALAGCGQLPTGGPSGTSAPVSTAAPVATQPGAPPPAQATQAGGPAPARTADSGALPSAPRTPSATAPAVNCQNYDDFSNRSFDGSINADLWPKAEPGQAVYLNIVQHDGFMEISNERSTGQSRLEQTLTLKRPGARTVDQLLCFEAKLRLGGAAHKAGFPFIKLHVVSDQNDVSECRLGSSQPGGAVQFACEFAGKYNTPFVAAKYDTWHKARIELRPIVEAKELIWNYFFDDVLIGSYNTGTSQMFYSKFTPSIVVSYNSAETIAASYFDDVKVTPATR